MRGRDDEVGCRGVGLLEDIACQTIAMDDNGAREFSGCPFGAPDICFNDANTNARLLLKSLGHIKPDIPAADDHDAAHLWLWPVEDAVKPVAMGFQHGDVGGISHLQVVIAARCENVPCPVDPDDPGAEAGKEALDLVQRRVEDRTVRQDLDCNELDVAASETDAHQCARRTEALQDGVAHFGFGRNNEIDSQPLAGKKLAPARRQILLSAHTGDLVRNVEQRVGNLANHHVDLVGIGHGDDHIAVVCASRLKNIGIAGMPLDPTHVEFGLDNVDQLRVLIDHDNVVVLIG